MMSHPFSETWGIQSVERFQHHRVQILGHASIAITGDVCGQVAPDASREAVERLSGALIA